jgi:hypothetical protein
MRQLCWSKSIAVAIGIVGCGVSFAKITGRTPEAAQLYPREEINGVSLDAIWFKQGMVMSYHIHAERRWVLGNDGHLQADLTNRCAAVHQTFLQRHPELGQADGKRKMESWFYVEYPESSGWTEWVFIYRGQFLMSKDRGNSQPRGARAVQTGGCDKREPTIVFNLFVGTNAADHVNLLEIQTTLSNVTQNAINFPAALGNPVKHVFVAADGTEFCPQQPRILCGSADDDLYYLWEPGSCDRFPISYLVLSPEQTNRSNVECVKLPEGDYHIQVDWMWTGLPSACKPVTIRMRHGRLEVPGARPCSQ